MINGSEFSSLRSDWQTPRGTFDELNREYKFNLDACASDENHLCPLYYTERDESLMRPWIGRVFMNPPYGRNLYKWVQKAYNETAWGNAELVCCLLPSRTDMKWWHDYCLKGEIRFIRGRLKFEGAKQYAPFPSVVVIFKA